MQDGISLIHRKAKVAREDFDARAMSPCKALRLSLAKVADAQLDLPLIVGTVEQKVVPQSAVKSEMDASGLLLVLDGAHGRRGAARLDTQFLAAVIEVQTMGVVQRGEAPERSVTPTDAAMVAPLIDGMLRGYDAYLGSAPDMPEPQNWRFGDMVEDGRTLALELELPEYDLFRITVDLGEGAKTGTLSILLPRGPTPDVSASKDGTPVGASTVAASALNAPAMLDAVLARVSMPLNKLCALSVGMQLTVPREVLGKAELLGAGQHVVAEVRLGQLNGWRAVRLLSGADERPDRTADADIAALDAAQAASPGAVSYLAPADHVMSESKGATVPSALTEASATSGTPPPLT